MRKEGIENVTTEGKVNKNKNKKQKQTKKKTLCNGINELA